MQVGLDALERGDAGVDAAELGLDGVDDAVLFVEGGKGDGLRTNVALPYCQA